MRINIQESEAEISELAGAICERLLCIPVENDDGSVEPCVFWLKIQGGRWHRFFIDSSILILVWREEDEIDEGDLTFTPEVPVLDIAAQYHVTGCVISRIQMKPESDDANFNCQLTISFVGGTTLILQCSKDHSHLSVVHSA
jgi:hypothetical protein